MAKKAPQYTKIIPKPVHPTAIRFHGLFGQSYVSKHYTSDPRWTPNSLMETYKVMTDMLKRHYRFHVFESNNNRNHMMNMCRKLRRRIRTGRVKLKNELSGDISRKIRKYLENHKDMQRLYHSMPIHTVADNINTRTFLLRKERDRLNYRLNQMKADYEKKIMIKADLENRINYQNEFRLEEELKSLEFFDRIGKSKIRLSGIRAINAAYKKMIDVLHQDEIFYEPIMRSLNSDYADLTAFIKHVLYLGMPAINRFKQLTREHSIKYDGMRRVSEKFKPPITRKSSMFAPDILMISDKKRYARETMSMKCLHNELQAIEETIKKIGTTTLCLHAKEIYPRIKSRMENNLTLEKLIEHEDIGHHVLNAKQQRADLVLSLLVNNRTEEETKRLKTMNQLREDISYEDECEAKTIKHLKNRSDLYVLLRFTLWNLLEILRGVDMSHSGRRAHYQYASSYLKLPFLKFEMINMRAAPPFILDENVNKLLQLIKRKVEILMKAYSGMVTTQEPKFFLNSYTKNFWSQKNPTYSSADNRIKTSEPSEEYEDDKVIGNILDNEAVKAISRKLVEENMKKDD